MKKTLINKKNVERLYRISLFESKIIENHKTKQQQFNSKYDKEKSKRFTQGYYDELTKLLINQKRGLCILYLDAFLKSIEKNMPNTSDYVYDSVREFIGEQFEDIESELKLAIEMELHIKDSYIDSLRLPGIVDKKFEDLRLDTLLYVGVDQILQYVNDKIKPKPEKPGPKKKTKPKGKIPQNIITEKYPNAKWEDVSFLLPNEKEDIKATSRIGIRVKGEKQYRYYYLERLGLWKAKKAKREWVTLKLILLNETTRNKLIGMKAKETMQATQVSRLRGFLKELTGINGDPFLRYDRKTLWYPKFQIKRVFEHEDVELTQELGEKLDYNAWDDPDP